MPHQSAALISVDELYCHRRFINTFRMHLTADDVLWDVVRSASFTRLGPENKVTRSITRSCERIPRHACIMHYKLPVTRSPGLVLRSAACRSDHSRRCDCQAARDAVARHVSKPVAPCVEPGPMGSHVVVGAARTQSIFYP